MRPDLPRWQFQAARLIVAPLFFLLGPLRTSGARAAARPGGLLVLANHLADVDPVAIQLGCARHLRFMAKSELFESGLLGRVLGWWRAFPVHRETADRTAIRTAIELLRAGKAVCVFPEGELSETGELLPFKPGVALIARASGAPAVCVGVQGTQRIMPYGKVAPRPAFSTVRVRWGAAREDAQAMSAEAFLAWAREELLALSRA